MPRPNLRRTAAEQARAEYGPQIRGVKRETQSQVRSVQSSGPALEGSLNRSAQQLRHAGLSPRDLTIALRELASRTADVGASTALQTQQIQQEGHGDVVDLLQAQGQAQKSALSALQAAAAEHAQDLQDERRGDTRDFKMDILKEEALKELGLGSYANDGGNGMTPTQERAAKEEHHTAAHYAKEYVRAAKGGLKDEETDEPILPAGPHKWNDDQWNLFVDKVASKGVSLSAAERAVSAVRDHFQPEGNLLKALGTVAGVAAPLVAPEALQPAAQFGSSLLRRR